MATMAKKVIKKDIHIYLTSEDLRAFEAVKNILLKLGMPQSMTPQAIVRYALNRAAAETR